jgi:AcrR family transcriptional regulator
MIFEAMKKSVTPDRSSAENPAQARILGAAFKAFTQDGYAGTSTLEIARRAKVSKRDLYANFSSKHAVLVACIMNRADRMRLPPDLPTPQSRQMLASMLTSFATKLVREVSHLWTPPFRQGKTLGSLLRVVGCCHLSGL